MKNNQILKYKNLYKDFIALFPDDKQFFDKMCEETKADEEDGLQHIMFGLVVVPFLKKIVIESPEKTIKAFDFLEKMETSGDPKIAEVLEFTVIEDLINDKEIGFEPFIPFLNKETKEAVHAVAQWFDVPY